MGGVDVGEPLWCCLAVVLPCGAARTPVQPPVIADLSLDIRPGEKVGVVGRTGAGKSSLFQALFRIVEPASGTVEFDGQDIMQYGLEDVRRSLAIIPQVRHGGHWHDLGCTGSVSSYASVANQSPCCRLGDLGQQWHSLVCACGCVGASGTGRVPVMPLVGCESLPVA